jgi:hypothetical protein
LLKLLVKLCLQEMIIPNFGIQHVKGNQSSLDAFCSVDAGVDHLVLVHAHSEVLQHSLQRFLIDAHLAQAEARVHLHVFREHERENTVVFVDVGLDVLVVLDADSYSRRSDITLFDDLDVLSIGIAAEHRKNMS